MVISEKADFIGLSKDQSDFIKVAVQHDSGFFRLLYLFEQGPVVVGAGRQLAEGYLDIRKCSGKF